jgi:hypothetical protein
MSISVALDLLHGSNHLRPSHGQGDPLLHLVGEFEAPLHEVLKCTYLVLERLNLTIPFLQPMHVVMKVFDFSMKGVGDTLLGISLHSQLRVEALLYIRQLLH